MTLRYKGQLIDLCGIDSQKIFDLKERHWVRMAKVFSSSTMRSVYGLRVPIVSRTVLVAYKTRLSRGVDIRDVEALRKAKR